MRFTSFVLFFICYLSISQNLPEHYYFSDDNQKLFRGGEDLDGFYSVSNIDTIFLYFEQNDYWGQMLDNYCDKINISATLIYEDEIFNEVGVRFKVARGVIIKLKIARGREVRSRVSFPTSLLVLRIELDLK